MSATEKSKARTTDAPPTHDWLESAGRDYAFGGYEFFGQEWGEKLIEEVKRLREAMLNPDEARAQVEGIHHLPDPRYHVWLMGRNKIRDMAGMGPQPHEVPPHTPGRAPQ